MIFLTLRRYQNQVRDNAQEQANKKKIEYKTIQKNSVQYNVRTVGIRFLLFARFVRFLGVAIRISESRVAKKPDGNFLRRIGKRSDFAVF